MLVANWLSGEFVLLLNRHPAPILSSYFSPANTVETISIRVNGLLIMCVTDITHSVKQPAAK